MGFSYLEKEQELLPLLIEQSDERVLRDFIQQLLSLDFHFRWDEWFYGKTPLSTAAKVDFGLEVLLEFDANPRLFDYDGTSPLEQACWSRNSKAIQTLITKGASIHFVGELGPTTTLHSICEHGNIDGLKSLIADHKGVDQVKQAIDLIDYSNYTPLMRAVQSGSLDCVWQLLDLGADVNFFDHRWGYPPLHLAMIHPSLEIVQLLLERGADPELKDCFSKTALERAREEDHPDEAILDLLRSK